VESSIRRGFAIWRLSRVEHGAQHGMASDGMRRNGGGSRARLVDSVVTAVAKGTETQSERERTYAGHNTSRVQVGV
jgi:hypothetical protein